MTRFTLFSLPLAIVSVVVAATPTPSPYQGKCWLISAQKQTCDNVSGEVRNYVDVLRILDADEKEISMNDWKPANARNSYVDLDKQPWGVKVGEQEKVLTMRRPASNPQLRLQGGSDSMKDDEKDDLIKFDYDGQEWTSEECLRGGPSSEWNEPGGWSVAGWDCATGAEKPVNPRVSDVLVWDVTNADAK